METLEGMNNTNLFQKSDEVARNDTKNEIAFKFYLRYKLSKQKTILRALKKKVTQKDVLPVTSKKFSNTQAKKIGFGFKGFISSLLYSVFDIASHYHCALFILGPSIIKYRAQTLTSEFVFKLGDSSKSVLTLGEAFTEFFPQIIDMMTIMQCYVLILWLVCPLNPVLQVSVVLMLVAAPCYYIPGLMNMASGVGVSWYSFKVPLIWFTVWGALALSLVFIFLTLLIIYLMQRCISPEPKEKEMNSSLDNLSETLIGMG